jgi:CDP-4-dehydro-6-deoxyglucose reductase
MPEIRLGSGTAFEAEPGTSILDAAGLAGVQLPYSCRTGRCSACKCKVVFGQTIPFQAETGLTDEEKKDGWILSCVRTADTDLVLETEDLGDIELPKARTLPCRIAAIEHLAPDVVRVLLRLPPGNQLDFLPGQYVEVIGTGGLRRSYSLAAAGGPGRHLELHVRAVEGGAMSGYWFNRARCNDLLRLNGPLGTFFLRDATGADLVFLATGTGIAPVKAILESIAASESATRPRSVTVLWGGRIPADLYLDIAAMPGEHSFIPVLSRAGDEWTGARGHVQDVLLGRHPDLGNTAVYACGSDAMIHSARAALLQAGLADTRFHSDAFVCSATPSHVQE